MPTDELCRNRTHGKARGANLEHLRNTIEKYLPFQPPLYSLDQITDRSRRFLASEVIREKIMRQLGEELPYDLTVQIESFKTEEATINAKTGRPKRRVPILMPPFLLIVLVKRPS